MKLSFAIASLFALVLSPLQAKANANISNFFTQASCKDPAGNLYVAGQTMVNVIGYPIQQRDLRIIKISGINHTIIWDKVIGVSLSQLSDSATDMKCGATHVSIGGVFTEGVHPSVQGPPQSYDQDNFLLRLSNTSGSTVFLSKFKGNVAGYTDPNGKYIDHIGKILIDSNGNTYALGGHGLVQMNPYLVGKSHWMIYKINSAGTVLWQQNARGPYEDPDPYYARNWITSAALSADELSLYVSGAMSTSFDWTNAGLLSINTTSGIILTTRILTKGVLDDFEILVASDIGTDLSGNVYFIGNGGDYTTGSNTLFTVKMDFTLNLMLWEKRLHPSIWNQPVSLEKLHVASNGTVTASGHIGRNNTIPAVQHYDIVTVRYNSAGTKLFQNEIASPSPTKYMTLKNQTVEANGSTKLAIQAEFYATNKLDMIAFTIGNTGTVTKSALYNSTGNMNDFVNSALVDNGGDMIAFGNSSPYLGQVMNLNLVKLKLSPVIFNGGPKAMSTL